MWNYDDTNFNEFPVKNELSDREFSNEELQFQIAFLALDQYYDTETLQYVREPIQHGEYVNYVVSVWTFDGYEYVIDESISTHRCNETDKQIFAKNFDTVGDLTKQMWSNKYCLDNPEKIKLSQG